MKVTIEVDDENEALMILNARSYFCALFEIREHLRSKDKYGADPPKDWAEVRDLIGEICSDINFNEIQ